MVEHGRGPLPFALIHGEALVACAAWALGEADGESVDVDWGWADVSDAVQLTGAPLLLHDPLCPLTPGPFLADCARQALTEDAVVVGVRPVTDTVKQVADGVVGATLDRDDLWLVCSPVVLPARLVSAYDELPAGPDHDFAAIVSALVAAGEEPRFVLAPPEARRVTNAEELRALEALTAAPHDLEESRAQHDDHDGVSPWRAEPPPVRRPQGR